MPSLINSSLKVSVIPKYLMLMSMWGIQSIIKAWLEIGVETGFSESYTPEGGELDLSQDVYDFVIISLPLRRAHEEGECNEETTKFLSK